MGKQKNAMPSKLRAVLNRLFWVGRQDLGHSVIVKHRFTGEFRVINK